MFDPMQAYLASQHQTSENFNNLDEEQYALRYGYVVGGPHLRSKISVQLGKLLIRVGEKMTGECTHTHVEFSKDMA